METRAPVLRAATTDDFDAIYAIWTQDHIIPFMTFERQPKEEFKLIFDKIMAGSDVYVIEENGCIVATRRIIPGSGMHAHTVELASFGVDKDHLGKGLGIRFYEELIKKIRVERPEVMRIEIGQETDNEVAKKLADKMGFKTEVILPDWIRRKTGPEQYTKKWNMAARFMAFYIHPEFEKLAQSNVEIYSPKMPQMTESKIEKNIEIQMNSEGKVILYANDIQQGECDIVQGVRRFAHVQFWEIQTDVNCDFTAMEICIRRLVSEQATLCKKIEISTSDAAIAELLKNLGFHCRGNKIGSCKIENNYYTELGCDFSFFNIQDAKELANIYITDNYQLARLNSALSQCEKVITNNNEIDQYAKYYLENMAFQMVRDSHGEVAVRRDDLWNELLQSLPDGLVEQFINLNKLTVQSLGQVDNTCANRTSLKF